MHHIARIVAVGLCSLVIACTTSPRPVAPPATQVVFVCEHGNVKSLMAASYFNELAHAQGLPFGAVSRGSVLDSDTAPDFIKSQLSAEGFDVSGFRPEPVTAADVSAADVVVTIGTALPTSAPAAASKMEQWNDVPPASTDYVRSRASLKAHVAKLLERLERSRTP